MIVKEVKFINDKIEIVLENKSFFISKENYIENPLSIDGFISEEKINYLLEQEKVIETKVNIIKLLNKKNLTEHEIKKKIKENNLCDKDALKIVDDLKRIGFVNDEYVGKIYVDSLLAKRKGKLYIIKSLKEKGIDDKTSYKLVEEIEKEIYCDNFDKIYKKYLKMYSDKPNKVKKEMVVMKLKEYGYEEEFINEIEIQKNEEEELELARINLNKIIKRKDINLNNYENINKIKIKLAAKGFNYDIINKVLEEVISDETY